MLRNLFNSKKAVLLIHGFAGGIYDYGDLATDLQLNPNYDIFTFTLPGHDKMTIKNVTKEDWIKSAETQLEKIIKNGYKKIYLIGHSMGGIIAAHLASKYPEVKKLVLAAPAYHYLSFKNDELDIIESIKTIPKIFNDYDTDIVISRILKTPIQILKEFTSLAQEHLIDVKSIDIPTLILYGTEDRLVPIDSVNYVYDNISASSVSLIQLKGLNHELFINDRYKEVKKLIETFLDGYNFSTKTKRKI